MSAPVQRRAEFERVLSWLLVLRPGVAIEDAMAHADAYAAERIADDARAEWLRAYRRYVMSAPVERDGFVIRDYEGNEVDFVACDKDGRMREKVYAGLAMRVDLDRFYFADTRDEAGTS